MKKLHVTGKKKVDNGTMVTFEIHDNGNVHTDTRLVANGFDRLLVPQTTGAALYAYL